MNPAAPASPEAIPPRRLAPGPWLRAARLASALLVLAVTAMFVAATIDALGTPPPSCTAPAALECEALAVSAEDAALLAASGWPPNLIMGALLAANLALNLAYIGTGVFILWRRPGDWLPLLLALSLVLLGAFGFSSANEWLRRMLGSQAGWLVSLLEGLTYGSPFLMAFVFPNGRFAPRWMAVVAVPLLALFLAPVLIPFSDEALAGLLSVLLGLIIYSQLYRYARVSNLLERQQTKWVAFGLLATTLIGMVWAVAAVAFPAERPDQARIAFLLLVAPLVPIIGTLFPASVAIAIFRYRLYDIDLILRRTLAYSLLSGVLLATYSLAVVGLQALVQAVTGRQQTELVTVVTTLLIAALFFPLRRRIQDTIDRRFFRRRYDAAQTLAAYAASVRAETDLAALRDRLLGVVQETMQPEWASLWLK